MNSQFDKDILIHGGYQYTNQSRLSSVLANEHFTKATLQIGIFKGKNVLDLGCGDGTYTIELYDRGQAKSIVGVDVAQEAIGFANQKKGDRKITYFHQDVCGLTFPDDSFDIATLRGLLHHMDDPQQGVKEVLRVAREVVIIEPNGYNIILKCIERFSSYHREHKERSFSSLLIDRWIRESGGRVVGRKWICLVPMFCPNWMAASLKMIEPLIEKIPIINSLACGSYVVRGVKETK